MARALDDDAAAPDAAAAQGGGAAAAPHGGAHRHHAGHGSDRHVCPFCGSLNESPVGPCPKCTMENTPASRKATKARIGPWYVLQQRNPAAPGMRWDTLLAFVRKGRIKPRSVVRGPSTHQLWRYALAVKGLSREFGLCYSCGGMIDKAAVVCPRCNRSQEPPANPDALLETPDDGNAKAAAGPGAVYRDVGTSPSASGGGDDLDIVVPALGAPLAAGVVGADVFSEEPAPEPPDAVAAASPVDAQQPPQKSPAAQPAKGGNANASEPAETWHVNDLAAAFKLQGTAGAAGPAYPVAGGPGGWDGNAGGGGPRGGGGGGDDGGFAFNPFGGGRTPDVPAVLVNDLPPFYPRRRSLKTPILTLLFVGLLGVALWLTLDDLARRRTFAWFEDAYAALRRTGGDKTVATQRKAPVPAENSAAKAVRPKPIPRPDVEPLMSLPPPPPSSATDEPPATTRVAATPATSTAPATAAVADAGEATEFPFTVPDASAEVPPAPAPPPPEPPAPDLEVLTQQARSLFNKGLTAEGNRDYREALRLYEQVKSTFPREAWPGGLEVRLGLARSQVK